MNYKSNTHKAIMGQSPILKTSEAGVIAIFLSVIISILLLTSTTLAARVTVVELNQASSVDQSEQAYYAAEAGVEEAARRIDLNPHATARQMFPNQYDGAGVLYGDTLNKNFTNLDPLLDQAQPFDLGEVSWRSRKVYEEGSAFNGLQVKDETVQFDTTEICRKVGGVTYGTKTCPPTGVVDQDVSPPGANIFSNFNGLQYCWTPNGGTVPSIELTDVFYAAGGLNTPNPVTTEKTMIYAPGSPSFRGNIPQKNGMQVLVTSAGGGQTCFQFTNNGGNNFVNFRYIFRVKPIFTTGSNQNFSVNYQATLMESTVYPPNQKLYLPNNSFLIDVVGQSGDIKRRVVARKLRSGRLIGIFDYVLYSGSSTTPLCKGGVAQSDGLVGSDCVPTNVINN